MSRAALMARVSSDEQAKGYSLDVQIESLTNFCTRNSIEIVKLFKEDHSAKSFNRPEFNSFLEYIKKNKGQIDLLLFTSWDRFSRNITEAYNMISTLQKLGVNPQAIEQPIDLSIPENKAMLALYLVLPEIENDRRSIKILGGIRGARKAGRWTNSAPFGYKNSRDSFNKPLLIPDENARLVKLAFEKVASGMTFPEIRKIIKKQKLSNSPFYRMFRNPVYIGLLKVPAGDGEQEFLTKGVHKPIISEKLFYKVQDILNQKKLTNNKVVTTTRREELPLRGVLICSKCGNHVTGSPSKSKTGKKHFYYHCNKCKKERYRAQIANTAIENILSEIKFSTDYQSLYKELLKNILNASSKEKEYDRKSIQEQLKKQNSRLNNLRDLLADGKLSVEEYNSLKTKYENDKIKLSVELNEINGTDHDKNKQIELAVKQLSNLSLLYKSFDLNGKYRLLSSIFPEKLIFLNDKCRTPRINELLRLALLSDKGFRKNKKGQFIKNLELSLHVELRGIEPRSKQGTHKLSTCVSAC